MEILREGIVVCWNIPKWKLHEVRFGVHHLKSSVGWCGNTRYSIGA
ncbi:hypothetical protein [Clostridium felsineum]|nr:hypothetical protein [Clostridium felsineum]